MITFFYVHEGAICGTFTSVVDMYLFLKDKFDVRFVIHTSYFHHMYRIMKKNFPKIKLDSVKEGKDSRVKSDVIITSSDTLTKSDEINFECDRVIFLDALGINISKYNHKEDKYFKKVPEDSILMGNESNRWASKYFSDFIPYHHKFSRERLEFISEKVAKSEPKNEILDVSVLPKIKDADILPHSYNEFHYSRWQAIAPDVYAENISKTMFEFRFLGKKAKYFSKNKTFDDGLTFYLRRFGIDDNFDHNIEISKEEIEEKMLYNDKDEILEIL